MGYKNLKKNKKNMPIKNKPIKLGVYVHPNTGEIIIVHASFYENCEIYYKPKQKIPRVCPNSVLKNLKMKWIGDFYP